MKAPELEIKEKQEVVAPAITEKKFIGRVNLQRGLKIWEILPNKQINGGIVFMVKEASYEDSSIDFGEAKNGLNPAKKKIVTREGCFYVQALNHKTALKKFIKTYMSKK